MTDLDTIKEKFKDVISKLQSEYLSVAEKVTIKSFLQSKEAQKKIGFQELVDKVISRIPPFLKNKEEIIEEALFDYFEVAATRPGDPTNFEKEDIELAERWLAEDLSINWRECRAIAIVNVQLPRNIFEINERLRLRRVTLFEVKWLLKKASIWGGIDPELKRMTSDGYLYPLYFIEYILDDEAKQDFFHREKGLEVTSEIDQLCRCIRILGDTNVGISKIEMGCWASDKTHSTLVKPSPELHPYYEWERASLKGMRKEIYESSLYINDERQKQLQEIWEAYKELRIKSGEFLSDFERALIRYFQALNEHYIDDIAIDLAISLESLVRSRGELAGYRVAALVSKRENIKDVCAEVNWLFEIRNRGVHGGAVDELDFNRLMRIQRIVRTALCASLFIATKNDVWNHKHAFRDLMDSWVVSCEEQKKSRTDIPEWILNQISEE